MGFIFPAWMDYQIYIVGESAHNAIMGFMTTVALAIALFELSRNLMGAKRPPARRKLKMKKLKNLSGEFLRSGATHSNPLFKETNFRFFVLGDVVDYSVMKLVSDDVPILADQEHQHAKLHHMAAKGSLECEAPHNRLIHWGFDKIFLRAPTCIAAPITFFMEAMSPLAMWYHAVSPLSKGMYSNLHLFHAYEEVEHASVTCHHLAELCPFPLRVLAMPVFGFFMELLVVTIPLFMIPCTIWNEPEVALKPRFWLLDIPAYFVNQLILEYMSLVFAMVHFLFAIPHFDWFILRAFADLEKEILARGFEWEVVQEEDFVLDESLHKKAPKTVKALEWRFYVSLVQPYVAPARKLGGEILDYLMEVLDRPVTDYSFDAESFKISYSPRSSKKLL